MPLAPVYKTTTRKEFLLHHPANLPTNSKFNFSRDIAKPLDIISIDPPFKVVDLGGQANVAYLEEIVKKKSVLDDQAVIRCNNLSARSIHLFLVMQFTLLKRRREEGFPEGFLLIQNRTATASRLCLRQMLHQWHCNS